MADAPLRVVVADDHPLYRDGVVRALEAREEFELAGAAGDGREALELIAAESPDVAVLDMGLPGMDGVEVIEALVARGSETRVLVLSASTESELVYRALAAGAAAYLSKDSGRQAICDAVAAVAAGESVISPAVQTGLAEQIRSQAPGDARPLLTDREREILGLVAGGGSTPQIAKQLFLSQATVKTHLQNVYEKLGVGDRAAAVAEGMRRGLVD